MSIDASKRVWQHSKASGSALVLLLALADHADDAGEAWPSQTTLARLAKITDRQVRALLHDLVAAGEIEIVGEGRRGVIVYRIACGDEAETSTPEARFRTPEADFRPSTPEAGFRTPELHFRGEDATPEAHFRSPRKPTSDEPSGNLQLSVEVASAPPALSKVDKPRDKAPRGARLSSDWKPAPDLAEWARLKRPDLDLDQVAEGFVDYWIGQPGEKGRKSDWNATFRNWVRKERQTFPSRQVPAAPAPVQFVDGEYAKWPGRVQGWVERGQWLSDMFGPPPGSPGCRVPAEFLSAIPQKPPAGTR